MPDIGDELERLAALRDRGVLTDSEFEKQKRALLSGRKDAKAGIFKPLGCGSTLAVLVIILIVFAVIGGNAQKQEATEKAAKPALAVTASELFRAYQANEARAQSMYGGQALLVSGRIAGVDLDLMNKPVVKLETDNAFMSAQASLAEADQPRAGSLSKGDAISLRCEDVNEVIGTPMLKDCSIQ